MLKKILNFSRNRISRLDVNTLEVLKKSSTSTVVKIAGMSVSLAVSVFLGRTIGADGLGVINLSNRIVGITLVIVLLGFREVLIKEISISHSKNNFRHIANAMNSSYLLNGGLSIVVSTILIFLSPWIAVNIFQDPRLTYPLMLALLVMTPQVFTKIFSSAFIGYHKIWQSNLVDQTLSIFLTACLLVGAFLMNWKISIILVAICYALSSISVGIVAGLYWKVLFHHKVKEGKLITKELLSVSLPLFVVTLSGLIITNVDIIILGLFETTSNIGIYIVAAQLALLTSFFLQVTNSAISPKIAALYRSKQFTQLEKMVQQVTKGLGIIGLLFFILYLIFGEVLLALWGTEFVNAYPILLILSLGQTVNISTGSTGSLFIMTGHEKVYMKINLFYASFCLISMIGLTYFFNAVGLAIAISATQILSNLTKVVLIRKYLNLKIISFSFPRL